MRKVAIGCIEERNFINDCSDTAFFVIKVTKHGDHYFQFIYVSCFIKCNAKETSGHTYVYQQLEVQLLLFCGICEFQNLGRYVCSFDQIQPSLLQCYIQQYFQSLFSSSYPFQMTRSARNITIHLELLVV